MRRFRGSHRFIPDLFFQIFACVYSYTMSRKRVREPISTPVLKQPKPVGSVTIGDLKSVATKKAKLIHSPFLITVNTNIPFKPEDPNLQPTAQILQCVLNEIFSNAETCLSVLNTRTKDFQWEHLHHQFVIERGPIRGCLHAHGIVEIIHRTHVQIGKQKIQSAVKALMSVRCKEALVPAPKNIRIQIKFIESFDSRLWAMSKVKEYISKTVHQSDETAPQSDEIVPQTEEETIQKLGYQMDQFDENEVVDEVQDEEENDEEEVVFETISDEEEEFTPSFQQTPVRHKPNVVQKLKLTVPDFVKNLVVK
jgi:hypothetical protein